MGLPGATLALATPQFSNLNMRTTEICTHVACSVGGTDIRSRLDVL